MVDHPLHEQRAHDREHLDRQGEGEQLSERAPQPDDAPDQRAQANARRLLAGVSSPTGVNSSATPVKFLDTAAIGRRRTPTAGS